MSGVLPVPGLTREPPSKRLSSQLARAALLIFCLVAAIASVGLYWSTRQSDEISVERQARVARHSMEIALDEIALQQETVAIWDESAEKLTSSVPDQQWLFDNMGSWLHRMFKHDASFLLDGHDRLVQATIAGKLADGRSFDRMRRDFVPLIESVRGVDHGRQGPHDRLPGQSLKPSSTVMTTPRATHDTHLMLVGARPAVASVMLVKPSTENYVRPRGDWPILVSVRYLDGKFMSQLQSRYLIDGARFSQVRNETASEYALLLRAENHDPLGYLIWKPELPGSRILFTLLPTFVAAIAALAVMILLLTRSLRQTLNERAALQARAAHLAYHDSLTGLPNRALLAERLQAALASARGDSLLSLLLIDLDRFKEVNDTLGHLAGDQLIREFSRRLTGLVRPRDTVARLGGDEFAVVLCDGWTREDIEELCEQIIGLFQVPFQLFGTQVFGGASIGAVHSNPNVKDATELMRRADVALYRAKADGRGCARSFAAGMDASNQTRSRLESELRNALVVDQLAVWSQPLVGRDREPVGHELLLRWRHPSLGFVTPEHIISLAEETGLIEPIGDWVLGEAARISAARPNQFTAVNLSPVQLRQRDFADRLLACFEAAGADPRLVELEVTEQTLLDRSSGCSDVLRRLRGAGFRIALDDFGTGFSSLSYLRELPVDKIKMDRSFVADLQSSPDARSIVSAIVSLGHALRLTVAAEGVETQTQAEILLAAGCDQLQGYLFGVPEPLQASAATGPNLTAAA